MDTLEEDPSMSTRLGQWAKRHANMAPQHAQPMPEFMATYEALHREMSGEKFKFNRRRIFPSVAGEALDLRRLFSEVQHLGGYQLVSGGKLWTQVCRTLAAPGAALSTSAAHSMRENYMHLLLPFEAELAPFKSAWRIGVLLAAVAAAAIDDKKDDNGDSNDGDRSMSGKVDSESELTSTSGIGAGYLRVIAPCPTLAVHELNPLELPAASNDTSGSPGDWNRVGAFECGGRLATGDLVGGGDQTGSGIRSLSPSSPLSPIPSAVRNSTQSPPPSPPLRSSALLKISHPEGLIALRNAACDVASAHPRNVAAKKAKVALQQAESRGRKAIAAAAVEHETKHRAWVDSTVAEIETKKRKREAEAQIRDAQAQIDVLMAEVRDLTERGEAQAIASEAANQEARAASAYRTIVEFETKKKMEERKARVQKFTDAAKA